MMQDRDESTDPELFPIAYVNWALFAVLVVACAALFG